MITCLIGAVNSWWNKNGTRTGLPVPSVPHPWKRRSWSRTKSRRNNHNPSRALFFKLQGPRTQFKNVLFWNITCQKVKPVRARKNKTIRKNSQLVNLGFHPRIVQIPAQFQDNRKYLKPMLWSTNQETTLQGSLARSAPKRPEIQQNIPPFLKAVPHRVNGLNPARYDE